MSERNASRIRPSQHLRTTAASASRRAWRSSSRFRSRCCSTSSSARSNDLENDLGRRAPPAEQRHRRLAGRRRSRTSLKRPYINVLLRVPQARVEPLDLPFIEPVLDQGADRQPVHRRVLRLVGRAVGDGHGDAGWSSTAPARRRRRPSSALPRGPRGRATGCCRSCADVDGARARSSRFPDDARRPASTTSRPSSASGLAGARAHDELRRVRGRRRAPPHASSSRRCSRPRSPACSSRAASRRSSVTLIDDEDAHRRVAATAHGEHVGGRAHVPARLLRPGAAGVRGAATKQQRRCGACAPATARRRFRTSSAPRPAAAGADGDAGRA